MTGTPDEFRRALRHAFGDAVSEDTAGLRVSTAGASIRFRLGSADPVALGVLRLPVLQVEVAVLHGDPEAARQLLARIDRATQRGGG